MTRAALYLLNAFSQGVCKDRRAWDGCSWDASPEAKAHILNRGARAFPRWLLSPTSWPFPEAAGATPPWLSPSCPLQASLCSSEGHPGRHGVGCSGPPRHQGRWGLLCSLQPTVSFRPLTGGRAKEPIIQTHETEVQEAAEQPCSHPRGDMGAGLGCGLGWLALTPCLDLGSYLGLWVPSFSSVEWGFASSCPRGHVVSVEPWGHAGPGRCCSHAPCAPHPSTRRLC